MPPKAKFTAEEIVGAALDIVREEGFSALTARSLGARLGSSSRPIFTAFKGMEEVQRGVINAAKEIYDGYISRGLSEKLPFKGVGTQYILFAVKEPKLFQLLFMNEKTEVPDLSGVLPMIDENYEKILLSIQADNRVSAAFAERLYKHLWIYTHGIASLCATKMCRFTAEEIGEMMTDVYLGLLMKLRKDAEQ